MRSIIIFSLIFLFSIPANFAQKKHASGIKVGFAGMTRISITKGKLRSVVDLGNDVEGCVYTNKSQRESLDRKGCRAAPPDFEVLDAAVKNNRTFLLVSAQAAGNCNVCGECGASEAITLFWLKLDARLRLTEKKHAVVESCLGRISLLDLSANAENNEDFTGFEFKDDLLQLDFEKSTQSFDEENAAKTYEFSHLEYNRKTPEKGFVIKTEKRGKSSAK